MNTLNAIENLEPLPISNNSQVLVPSDLSRASKDHRSRLQKFSAWLDDRNIHWYNPDLSAYCDDLKAMGKAATTIAAALSTIRARYAAIIRDRDRFFELLPEDMTFLEKQALVNEAITRIQNAIHPDSASISVTKHQDKADDDHLRLTREEANALLRQPNINSLVGLRDTAVIALMLCTGIREMEVAQVEVTDLRQKLGGELALCIQHGKGNKARLIPYGDLNWCLVIVDRWLRFAGIDHGPVFRGFYKGGKSIRSSALTERAVQNILAAYPIAIAGQQREVKPHDLRRTYARRLYEAGVDLVAIQQNLGHADLKTTLGYIGALDADKRRAKAVYDYDLTVLPKIIV